MLAQQAGETLPDVSAEGDYDNLWVNNGAVYTNYGGTSFAAPRWAGLIALANQQAAANCENPVGFIPPTLYSTLNTQHSTLNTQHSTLNTANHSNNFHDVMSGNDHYTGSISYNAVSNYDLVTGLGSSTG